jgi:hypothetical protein
MYRKFQSNVYFHLNYFNKLSVLIHLLGRDVHLLSCLNSKFFPVYICIIVVKVHLVITCNKGHHTLHILALEALLIRFLK